MNRSSRLKNVHSRSREKLDRKTILKDDTADRHHRKKKFSTKKKRKKLSALGKKNTLMVGMFKNGAKGQEICTAAPALTASNKARLNGDILLLLNGESKNTAKDRLTCSAEKKVLSHVLSAKEAESENPEGPPWSPRTCYRAFCTAASARFKDEKSSTDSPADTFRLQIFEEKAKTENRPLDASTLGLANALHPCRVIQLENLQVPASSYTESSDLLLKPMNNISLESQQPTHLFRRTTKTEPETDESIGPFSSASDLSVSDVEKHHLQNNGKAIRDSNYETKPNRMPFTRTFHRRASLFEGDLHSPSEGCSADAGKDTIMKRYLKCLKQPSKAKVSFANKDTEIVAGDVNFERVASARYRQLGVDENAIIDNVVMKERGPKEQPPPLAVNSKAKQFAETDCNRHLDFPTPYDCRNDCLRRELPGRGESFEMSIPTNIFTKRDHLRTNLRNTNKQVFLVENTCFGSTFPKQRDNRKAHVKRNLSTNTINSAASGGTLVTPGVYGFSQPILFKDSDAKNADPAITPTASPSLASYLNYPNWQNTEFSSVDHDTRNFYPSSDFRLHNSKPHGDRRQKRSLFVSKNRHCKSRIVDEPYTGDYFVKDPESEFSYQQNSAKDVRNKQTGAHKASHPTPVKKTCSQRDARYLPRNKDFEGNDSTIEIPVYFEDNERNCVYPHFTARTTQQPTKYLAVAESSNNCARQRRIPLYLQVTGENPLLELPPRQPVDILQFSREDTAAGASNVIFLPKDKVHGKVTLIPAMHVASDKKLSPADYKMSEPSEYYKRNLTKVIPCSIRHSRHPQSEDQTRFLGENAGVDSAELLRTWQSSNDKNLAYTHHSHCNR